MGVGSSTVAGTTYQQTRPQKKVDSQLSTDRKELLHQATLSLTDTLNMIDNSKVMTDIPLNIKK